MSFLLLSNSFQLLDNENQNFETEYKKFSLKNYIFYYHIKSRILENNNYIIYFKNLPFGLSKIIDLNNIDIDLLAQKLLDKNNIINLGIPNVFIIINKIEKKITGYSDILNYGCIYNYKNLIISGDINLILNLSKIKLSLNEDYILDFLYAQFSIYNITQYNEIDLINDFLIDTDNNNLVCNSFKNINIFDTLKNLNCKENDIIEPIDQKCKELKIFMNIYKIWCIDNDDDNDDILSIYIGLSGGYDSRVNFAILMHYFKNESNFKYPFLTISNRSPPELEKVVVKEILDEIQKDEDITVNKISDEKYMLNNTHLFKFVNKKQKIDGDIVKNLEIFKKDIKLNIYNLNDKIVTGSKATNDMNLSITGCGLELLKGFGKIFNKESNINDHIINKNILTSPFFEESVYLKRNINSERYILNFMEKSMKDKGLTYNQAISYFYGFNYLKNKLTVHQYTCYFNLFLTVELLSYAVFNQNNKSKFNIDCHKNLINHYYNKINNVKFFDEYKGEKYNKLKKNLIQINPILSTESNFNIIKKLLEENKEVLKNYLDIEELLKDLKIKQTDHVFNLFVLRVIHVIIYNSKCKK